MSEDKRVEEIRARLAKATPGPWYMDSDCDINTKARTESLGGFEIDACVVSLPYDPDNADFKLMANAHGDIAFLLAELDKARRSEPPRREAEQRVLEAALKAYNDNRFVGAPTYFEELSDALTALVEKAPPAQEPMTWAQSADGSVEGAPPAPKKIRRHDCMKQRWDLVDGDWYCSKCGTKNPTDRPTPPAPQEKP